jgi:hypothetical protein
MTDRIDMMARRRRDDPFFLAVALEEHARGERLDAVGLAAALGCAPDILGPLGLCRHPRPESFWPDVERIAERFGLTPETLAGVIRRADTLAALRGPAEEHGWLAAARDRQADRKDNE